MNRNGNSGSRAESGPTYQQLAYDFVKARIMNLELKPGQYITDSQVAGDLNISRTPVREALRRLEQENLLINEARHGWKVYALALKDIHEIFDIKETLEGLIIRRAAAYKGEELRRTLKEALERMQRATQDGDSDAWLEADAQLHEIIFTMGGNERASNIIRGVNDQWYRVRIGLQALEGRMQRSTPEHEHIVEHILAGDGEEAARLNRTHVNSVRDELVRVLVNLVFPFAEEGV